MNFHHKYLQNFRQKQYWSPRPPPSLSHPPEPVPTPKSIDVPRLEILVADRKWNRNQHSENTFNKTLIYMFGVLENETETNSTAIFLTKQLSICLVFWKMKRKPTAQREHFQQNTYLYVRCLGKWNRNQQHSDISNEAVIHLFGVLENETETNSTARTLPTKQLSICSVFWKIKRKPTQREHFQQSSYPSVRCFGKWNRNQKKPTQREHFQQSSYLLGVLENEKETNTARTLPTK